MQKSDATVQRLVALKQLGERLAIDDFGTGYSGLSYLQRFPIDVLKIDRSFVQGDDDRALVHTIVQLARTLRLATVAEGIETADQLDRLRTLGCDFGQGFLFAHPLPADEIAELLQAPEPVAASA